MKKKFKKTDLYLVLAALLCLVLLLLIFRYNQLISEYNGLIDIINNKCLMLK